MQVRFLPRTTLKVASFHQLPAFFFFPSVERVLKCANVRDSLGGAFKNVYLYAPSDCLAQIQEVWANSISWMPNIKKGASAP